MVTSISFMTESKPRTAVLIILDGFGINPDRRHNAVALAHAPNLTRLLAEYPNTAIQASENYVGLPQGFMGNSEVGHLNIGAGRVVYQDFSLISKAIEEKTFYSNPVFEKLLNGLHGKTLHLLGLVSDGGVHSHLSHLFALMKLASEKGIARVRIHAFTDGRDTSPDSGAEFIRLLEKECAKYPDTQIVTVAGRFFGMDRDTRWERTEASYSAIVEGQAAMHFTLPVDYIRQCYANGVTDEFLPPAVRKGYTGVETGGGAIFFNFRADRARQMTGALAVSEFTGFERKRPTPFLGHYVCMTPYDASLGLPTAYEKPRIPMTLGEMIEAKGWRQLRIAETEKYAHVTYFFNGGEERVFTGENRILIPSPREVKTYDLKPEMSAEKVADALLKELETGTYQLAVVNFANCDMVGHTGILKAAIQAVEVVDRCVGRIVDWVEKNDAFAILTADHGNCEKMEDDKGSPLTAHTLLPVPFIVIDPSRKEALLAATGKLSDIAPTLLDIWGLPQPVEMTGRSLLVKRN